MKEGAKYSFLEAKQKLEWLCVYQERCSFELEKKLYEWGIAKEDADALLAHLITENFLSEERFALAYCSGKVSIKKWGRQKIQAGLKARRISNYSIDKAMNSIDQDLYWLNLAHLVSYKWNLLKNEKDAFKKKMKVVRYLSSKGYESDLIYDAIQEFSDVET